MKSDDKRDFRIDVLRGVALLRIFVDHIPRDALGFATLHDFGFCDAAEVFVLLVYLPRSSTGLARAARHRFATPIAACGRHSLEVFSASCMLSLFGRLASKPLAAACKCSLSSRGSGSRQ